MSREFTDRLAGNGVGPGMRIGLLVPPGIRFVALVFALFRTGATVILVDPGIGRKNLVKCLARSRPDGFVGVPKAHFARWVYRKQFPDAALNFVTGIRYWPGCLSLDASRAPTSLPKATAEIKRGDPAAIIFTSGSTGPPKGVCYTHDTFIQQAKEVRDGFRIQPGGADVSGFPLFALFNTAMGKTTVFPDMDFTRPAKVDPPKFLAAAAHFRADQSFGSPALWNTVCRWCERNHKSLPTIRKVMSAGAPVPAHVLRRIRGVIASDGEAWTPYGATEALPVASISATTVLGETAARTAQGQGVCVGNHFCGIEWRVIEITDEPLAEIGRTREIPRGEIGELMVRGRVVTKNYFENEKADSLAKVRDGDSVWHRMGDVGWLDEADRFWFCGRKSQRVLAAGGTLFTIPCEAIINNHPAIYRSALVGVGEAGRQIPAIVAEPWPEHWPVSRRKRSALVGELAEMARANSLTASVRHIFLKRQLPVDIRHNSKIFREQLREWAARQPGLRNPLT
jgi:olefin beta-lactone synthetase